MGCAVGLLIGAGLLSACGSSSSGSAGGGGSGVVYIGGVTPNPYYDGVYCGIKAEAKKDHLAVRNVTPSSFTAAAQVQAFNAALGRRPSAIVLGPAVASATAAPIASAVKAGVPVAVVANPPFASQAFTYINADVAEATREEAAYVAHAVPKGSQVAILGLETNNGLDQGRVAGLKAGIKEQPGLQLVTTQYSGVNTSHAASIVSGLLSAHPQLKAILASSGTPTLGAASELQALHKSQSVTLAGYDAEAVTIQKMKAGSIQAVVSQLPEKAGALAVQSIVAKLHGKSVPKVQNYPPFLVTTHNVSSSQGQAAVYSSSC